MTKKKQTTQTKPPIIIEESTSEEEPSVMLVDEVLPEVDNRFVVSESDKATLEQVNGPKKKPTSIVEEVTEAVTEGMVQIRVLAGSLSWEGGTFEKGQTFVCSPERAALFDTSDVKVV